MRHLVLLRALALTACSLCLLVVVLGAYVRLSDAGLGCPDWPGCYGHLTPAGAAAEIDSRQGTASLIATQSGRPLELGKAWREMLHRYAASTLGVLIIGMTVMTLLWRRERIAPANLLLALLGIVLVQGIFGRLTVTWRLNPLIVTLHLLLGLTTLSLLWWLLLGLSRRRGSWRSSSAPGGNGSVLARPLALLGLLALALQIALGGWTSSNYAAIACPDLPTCQGSWWPPADFHSAYGLWHAARGTPALVAIHLTHRIGAMVASAALLAAAASALWRRREAMVRRAALAVLLMLALQLTLGVSMVLRGFPLWLATAHNAGAALLLLATLWLNYSLRAREPSPARAVFPAATSMAPP
jgi:cytochrome c oxidase assembly protein subunit 15